MQQLKDLKIMSSCERIILTIVLSLPLFVVTISENTKQPHIIFIVADDLGWNDVSFHGSRQIPTPNIDYLAHSGIILNNYYVDPICTPTRSAIMTGRYPIHTGMWHSVILGAQPYGLSLNQTILPQYLKSLNYSTHAVGKWHLGFFRSEYTPTYRGFDTHYGYWCGHQDYYDHTAEESVDYWGVDFHSGMQTLRNVTDQYATELYSNRAVRIIKEHDARKPLFLYVAHLAVHSANSYSPLQAPPRYLDPVKHISHKQRRTFGGMVTALDESVGNITAALVAAGMLDNSIIIFTTDNGGPAAGFDLNYASNFPLRGVKDTLWEGGVRGVGFIWSSSRLAQRSGEISEQLMHVTDWLPTIYSAAIGGHTSSSSSNQLRPPTDIDGHDMWRVLTDKLNSPRRQILHNIDNERGIAALRLDDYKVVIGDSYKYGDHWNGWYLPEGEGKPRPSDHLKWSGFADSNKKLSTSLKLSRLSVTCGPPPANVTTNCQPELAPCLFNIRKDPCEYHNLANSQPKVLAHLLDTLQSYNRTVAPNRKRPVDPMANPKYHDYAWIPWRDDLPL